MKADQQAPEELLQIGPVNETGIYLSPREMVGVRISVAQINRRNFVEFETPEEGIAYLDAGRERRAKR